jgi:hypothetical protein
MVIYMAFLAVQSPQNLFWVYPLKTIAVAVVLWVFRKRYEELRSPMICRASAPLADVSKPMTAPNTFGALQCPITNWLLAILVGLVAIAIWIGIDPFYLKFGRAEVLDPGARWGFIGFRVAGAVLVVPLMEELFWRAFLIRWLVNEDFKRVPVGTFTWPSFAITVALFGAEHQEWLAGLICGAMYNWLFYKRKDVFSCVVAHAVSNAALAGWVLARGDWKFW